MSGQEVAGLFQQGMNNALKHLIPISLLLTACASTGDADRSKLRSTAVDENGFQIFDDSSAYAEMMGLYCPAFVDDLRRTKTMRFGPKDVACNYEGDRDLTIYFYDSPGTLEQHAALSVQAAEQGNVPGIRASDALTEICRTTAMGSVLIDKMLGLAASESSSITISTDGSDDGFPYVVEALEGGGARSYVAMSRTEFGLLKARYTVIGGENSEESRQEECAGLHRVVRGFHGASGTPKDADISFERDESDLANLLDVRSKS